MNWPLSVQGFTVLKAMSPSSECKGFFSHLFSSLSSVPLLSHLLWVSYLYIFSHKILNSTLHSFLSQIEMIVNSAFFFFAQQRLTFQALFKVLGSYTTTTNSVMMVVFSISMCTSHSAVGYDQRLACVSSSATVHHKLWSSEHAGNFLDCTVWSSLPSSPREVEQDPLIPLYRYHRTETSSTTDNSSSHWRKSYIKHTGSI